MNTAMIILVIRFLNFVLRRRIIPYQVVQLYAETLNHIIPIYSELLVFTMDTAVFGSENTVFGSENCVFGSKNCVFGSESTVFGGSKKLHLWGGVGRLHVSANDECRSFDVFPEGGSRCGRRWTDLAASVVAIA